jgi:CRISPR-associated protein Csm3
MHMAVEELKLEKYMPIRARLVAKSGLRIGGTEADIKIGGAENPVIRDFNGVPYIPGSSLKGKLRSLLEQETGRFGRNGTGWMTDRQGNRVSDGNPCGCADPTCLVCKVFGPHMNPSHGLGPSRIIVRDAYLTKATREKIAQLKGEGKEFSETKTETMVNRWTGVAADRSLRTQERIPAGAEFDLEISLRIFKGDDEQKLVEFVKKGLDLLQKDYLGGSGTRGYGWVEIQDLQVSDA